MPISIGQQRAAQQFNPQLQPAPMRPGRWPAYKHLSKVANNTSAISRGWRDDFDLPVRSLLHQDRPVGNSTLAVRSAFQAALVCLYAQHRLGAAPGSLSSLSVGADDRRGSSTLATPGDFNDKEGRHVASFGPFVGVEATPDGRKPLLAEAAKHASTITGRLTHLGHSLILAGAAGLLKDHPGRQVAAATAAAGLVTLGLAAASNAISYGSIVAPSSPDIREELASIKQPDGKTLYDTVRDAIHHCAGNNKCERTTVERILAPYREQLGFARQDATSEAKLLPGAQAAAILHDMEGGYIDQIIAAVHHWDEQSFLSDVETIARAPTNGERRDAIIGMLDDRGYYSYLQAVMRQSPEWLTGEPRIIAGANIIGDVTPSEAADMPVLFLGAHLDKIGKGSGAYDNGAAVAAILAVAESLRANPPENCRVRMVFFDQEETGINGSKAFVEECLDENNCPAMLINFDPFGNGDEIYAASSNATHLMAFYADDRASARTPILEKPSETRLLNELRGAARESPVKVKQNNGTIGSDHLAFQFKGLPAVGLALLNKGQPEETARTSRAMAKADLAHEDFKPTEMADALAALEAAYKKGYSRDIHQAQIRFKAAQESARAYRTAMLELHEASSADSALQNMHNEKDRIEAIRPREVVAAINVVEKAIRAYCAGI